MNKFLTAAVAAASIASSVSMAQSPSIDNPVTKAMLDVYAEEIAANPNNPDIFFRRANEYYKFNQYLRALADVDKAIALTPEKNSDLRFQCFMLKADIYQMLNKHHEALQNFTDALKEDPTSFMALYQKANEEYELGDYSSAKADYTRLRSLNPRGAEALTGLARVAVKENNLGLASEYMDGAVEMMSADSDIYIRRASIRRMQNNNTGAVEDLLMAISIDNNTRAFQEIVDLANVDYPAVIAGLSTSISYAPKQGMLYYIRGFIAQAHDHYTQALADYHKLIDENMYEYAGLYNSIAQCELALCKYPSAMDNVDHAIAMDEGKTASFYATKAAIYYAQGRYDFAEETMKEAQAKGSLTTAENDMKGFIEFALDDFNAANELFGELIVDTPDVMKNYIYRAWVLASGLKQAEAAGNLYRRVVSMTDNVEADEETDAVDKKEKLALSVVNSYRNFALLFSGDKAAAVKWTDDIQRDYRDTDGYLSFMAACLYAQADEKDKAFAALDKALSLGYGNLYELTTADYGRVSLAPIRSDERFNAMLAKYAHLFE